MAVRPELPEVSGARPGRREVVGLAAALALGLGLCVGVMLASPSRLVDYLSDDAFYYFRVATHLAAGDGPTFDGITRTTGFHPLYAFALAGLAKLFALGERGLPAAAIALNTLCYLLTGVALYEAARRLWDPRVGSWAAILWFANPHAILLVVTGMEGSLYAASVAALCAALAATATRPPASAARATAEGLLLGACAGLCYLARTDALIILGLVGLWLLLRSETTAAPRALRVGAFALIAALPALVWTAYCWRHGGQLLQGSAGAKLMLRRQLAAELGFFGGALFGAKVFGTWAVKCLVKAPALKWTLPFLPRATKAVAGRWGRGGVQLMHGLYLAPAVVGLAYAALLPRPWTWYYAPALVLLTPLAAAGVAAWVKARRNGAGGRYTRALPLVLALVAVECVGYLALKGVHGRNPNQRDMLAAALWVRDNVPADARVAAWNAGIYSWWSGRTVINLDGLVNNEIVALQQAGGAYPEYWDRRGVTHLVDYDEEFAPLPRRWDRGALQLLHRQRSAFPRGKDISVYKIEAVAPPDLPAR